MCSHFSKPDSKLVIYVKLNSHRALFMDILFTENIKLLPGHVDEEELDREKSKL